MIPEHTSSHTNEIPACKREHFLKQTAVEHRAITTFFKMSPAIYPVGKAHQQYGQHHECSIENKSVIGRIHNQKSHPETKQAFHYSDYCVSGHLFMSSNGCHLRHTHQIDYKRKNREMQHPFRCRNTGRLYGHFILNEPQSDRLGNQNHNCGQNHLDSYSC